LLTAPAPTLSFELAAGGPVSPAAQRPDAG
jgi:hypothetical protein